MIQARDQLLAAFQSAVQTARPDQAVRRVLQTIQRPSGKTVVVGGGKAAASMAKAFEDAWESELEGVVVTRYGHATELPKRIKLLEAGLLRLFLDRE